MKARIIAIVLLAALMLSVLTACGGSSKVITSEEAQKIALEASGYTADQVSDIHTHILTEDGIPCYSVHLTTEDGEFSYVIHAGTGEIIG